MGICNFNLPGGSGREATGLGPGHLARLDEILQETIYSSTKKSILPFATSTISPRTAPYSLSQLELLDDG